MNQPLRLNERPADFTGQDDEDIALAVHELLAVIVSIPGKFQATILTTLIANFCAGCKRPEAAWADIKAAIDRDMPGIMLAIGRPAGHG